VSKCSVVLVDDHAVFREALAKGLESDGGLMVVGQAGSSGETLKLLAETRPQVLVLDLSLPGRGGGEVLEQVLRRFPEIRVLILSSHPPDQFVASLVRRGASGYLHKSCSLQQVQQAVQRVADGRIVVDEALLEILARRGGAAAPGLPHEALSHREHQVMERLVEGARITDIAAEMNLSVKTVSTYRKRILDKLGMASNSELVGYAIRHSLGVCA
jgi:DNA-binding NarL/FixJ family response regulator